MHALRAGEHLAADARVADVSILQNRARDRDGALGVVGGLADAPLALRIPGVARDDRSRFALESAHAVRIPSDHAFTRQCLGLLPDRVACRNTFQGTENPRVHHRRAPAQKGLISWPPMP